MRRRNKQEIKHPHHNQTERQSKNSSISSNSHRMDTNGKKWMTTCALFFMFITAGINYNLISPTLTQLQHAFNTSLPEVSIVYTFRSAGYIMGAPIGGLLFTLFNRQLVLTIFVFIMSTTIFLLPNTGSLFMLYLDAGINGLANGCIETGVNVWLLEIWSTKSSPFMQALHFCFSLGCALAPLMAAPFLREDGFADSNSLKSHLQMPYLMTGLLVGMSGFFFALLFIFLKQEVPQEETRQADVADKMLNSGDDPEEQPSNPDTKDGKIKKWIKDKMIMSSSDGMKTKVVLFSCITMLFYSGMSITYNQFMPTYLQNLKGVEISAATASYIHSGMNYASTIARGLFILVALRIKPEFIIYFNCSMISLGSFLLLFVGNSIRMTWLSNILIGIGSASVSAPLYSFIRKYLEVTNMTGSIFVFSSGLTSVFFPLLMGKVLINFPQFLLYFNLINIALTLFFFTLIYIMLKKSNNKKSLEQKSDDSDPQQQQTSTRDT